MSTQETKRPITGVWKAIALEAEYQRLSCLMRNHRITRYWIANTPAITANLIY